MFGNDAEILATGIHNNITSFTLAAGFYPGIFDGETGLSEDWQHCRVRVRVRVRARARFRVTVVNVAHPSQGTLPPYFGNFLNNVWLGLMAETYYR